ncbi:hypothetical protein KP509_14G012200 [Ceratopteris richardii]|uniref:Uncharacterized protein n=1 Tax=Ceratopteris richardii TaxID=49495 RepID=A0A8T2TCC5_CERRI|nr:hypothetical protein KP509_14G012200 [Ceratopteris richardii]
MEEPTSTSSNHEEQSCLPPPAGYPRLDTTVMHEAESNIHIGTALETSTLHHTQDIGETSHSKAYDELIPCQGLETQGLRLTNHEEDLALRGSFSYVQKTEEIPEWVDDFINGDHIYFQKCSVHDRDIKFFTFDCLESKASYLCQKCIELISEPQSDALVLLQIRKCSHNHSVASEQLAKYIDVKGIFNFTINNMKVHYLVSPQKSTPTHQDTTFSNYSLKGKGIVSSFSRHSEEKVSHSSFIHQSPCAAYMKEVSSFASSSRYPHEAEAKPILPVPKSNTTEQMTNCLTCKQTYNAYASSRHHLQGASKCCLFSTS